ncbi:hypothetical protein [Hymenobacter latericus]|uniref:hypothetical protein n=1 Tax=Hymenobacter sp. YIM 151858-1 TaxID=2987688 RepID=UPI0022265DD2|nr:hypothetical protein [Hymenobacter sp. YIM 151858-1]UYZ60483.1 hypothetical protein OIS50_06700 [Hymenobacter sp. YIM 151858-1]
MSDKPDYRKLYHPGAFNAWQYIAFTGVIMSLGAQLVLFLLQQPRPQGFHWLYVCWAVLFVLGSLSNLYGKPDDHHHH